MSMTVLRKVIGGSSAALLLAALLGAGIMAGASDKKTSSAPAKPAAAPKAAPVAHPGGASAGGAAHGTTTGAAHGPTANGSHGPTANGTASHGPTANGSGARTTTGSTAGRSATTTAGARTANGAGNRTSVRPAAASRSGADAPHTAIKSPAPKGSVEHTTRNGSAIRTRSNGRVSDVHDARRGMDVHHGLNGGRRVSVERADHSRVFSERGRRGFVERPYRFHGRDFARRSYYYHGRAYDRYYHGYYYRGAYVNVYAPGIYYAPAFYGWAYNPWAAPIAFGWGWAGNPWFGFYGAYFQPYAVYPSAAFWLTDYIISQELQAAYAAHVEANEAAAAAAAGGAPLLTPEVKQMIADEVRNQLALENQEAQMNAQQKDVDPASSGIARMLSDGHPHVFVAGSSLDLVQASGQECAISDGDALQLQTPPPADATAADLVVLSSKGGQECPKSSTVSVQVADLQEMQNHMRETIDQGLQDLKDKQGKGGLPTVPPSAESQPAPALYASAAPPPETNLATDIQQQAQEADQSEKEVTAEAAQSGGAPVAAAPAPMATVALGQNLDDVKAALGNPTRVANLGPKVIYYYNGMKVTFKDGKVTDVQ